MFLAYSDASFANCDNARTQLAFVATSVSRSQMLSQNAHSKCNVLGQSSHRMKRVASATLLTEAAAVSEALSECVWACSWFKYFLDPKYERKGIGSTSRQINPRSIQGKESTNEIVEAMLLTDSKSLYDAVAKMEWGIVTGKQLWRFNFQVIKTQLTHMKARLRWIPHDSNVADALTKLHGNAEPLLMLLDQGKIMLIDEETELTRVTRRKQWRDEHGGRQNPRPKRPLEGKGCDHRAV
eukprot:2125565-Amphidinium_carterae.2